MSSETERVTYCILKRFDEQGPILPTKDYQFRTLDTELQMTARDWLVTGIGLLLGSALIICIVVGAISIGRWLLQ